MKPLRLGRAWITLVVIALAWLSTAGSFGLLEPTETRYSEIAREMRAGGDWLVPRLNGIPHFHKPPLAYWMTALGFALWGENAWGGRLPAVLAGIATLALLVPIARRRFAALGLDPAAAIAITGTMPLVFFLFRSVATDPYLSLAVVLFWALAPSPWALAALGLGFFAKGPVVLVPTVLAVLVVAAVARDRSTLRMIGPARGWWLFAAIALPWYLLVVARTPGLLAYLLENQIVERYATKVHQRPGPPWYFVGVVIAGALPWTAALVAGIARLWRERARPEARLLLAWLLAPLVFFSFSGSKLPAYILPCFPAAGLIAAIGFAGAGRAVRGITAALLAALAIAGWALAPGALGRLVAGAGAEPLSLSLAGHAAFALMLCAAVTAWRGRAVVTAVALVLAWTALAVTVAPYEGPLGSPRPLVRLLREQRNPGEPVVEYRRFNAGVPFYLGETVRLLDVPRETGFVDPLRRAAVTVTRDSLAALADRHGRVWILGPRGANAPLADSLGLRYRQAAVWKREGLGFITR